MNPTNDFRKYLAEQYDTALQLKENLAIAVGRDPRNEATYAAYRSAVHEFNVIDEIRERFLDTFCR